MKKFLLVFFFFIFAAQVMAGTNTVQARVVRRRTPVQKVDVLSGSPVTTFSYNPRNHHFSLRVRPLQPGSRVTYTIAYTRRGTDSMEALQGARRITRSKTFLVMPYAGTQSSHYFIPHTVTGGTLDVSGTDVQGNPYTVHETFVIQGRKFVITSS